MSQQNNDNQRLDAQVADLHKQMRDALQASQRRVRRTTIGMIVLIAVIIGYWSYIYAQIGRIDADAVAFRGYQISKPHAERMIGQTGEMLKQRAPEFFDYAETRLMKVPSEMSQLLRQRILAQTQFTLDQSEGPLATFAKDTVANAKQQVQKRGYDMNDPAQVEKMIDDLVVQLHAGVRDSIDKIYLDLADKTGEVVQYIEQMAANECRDKRQQLLREVLIASLAVSQKQQMTSQH